MNVSRLGIAFTIAAILIGAIVGVGAARSAKGYGQGATSTTDANGDTTETIPIYLYSEGPPSPSWIAWGIIGGLAAGGAAAGGVAAASRRGRRPGRLVAAAVLLAVLVGGVVGARLTDGWWWPVTAMWTTSSDAIADSYRPSAGGPVPVGHVYRPVPDEEGGPVGVVILGLVALGGVAIGRRSARTVCAVSFDDRELDT